jgi:3-methyladenine DNA glycosylase AlkD
MHSIGGPLPARFDAGLVTAVRRALAEAADPERAVGAQAYMKSVMPFRGVAAPAQRALYKTVFAAHTIADAATWRATALTLWREAAYREERYAAIELTGAKRYTAFQALDTVPMYDEMIVTGAWWDYVDAIASHRIGPLVAAFPARMKPLMRRWGRDDDMWRRRTAILCQITFKQRTDLDLLYACIEPNLADTEFFIRKAIGWALRSYAWTDPREVARYVRLHERELSGLSRREAMKNISDPRQPGTARTRH